MCLHLFNHKASLVDMATRLQIGQSFRSCYHSAKSVRLCSEPSTKARGPRRTVLATGSSMGAELGRIRNQDVPPKYPREMEYLIAQGSRRLRVCFCCRRPQTHVVVSLWIYFIREIREEIQVAGLSYKLRWGWKRVGWGWKRVGASRQIGFEHD